MDKGSNFSTSLLTLAIFLLKIIIIIHYYCTIALLVGEKRGTDFQDESEDVGSEGENQSLEWAELVPETLAMMLAQRLWLSFQSKRRSVGFTWAWF